MLLIAALIGGAGDVRAGDDPPVQSPTPEERQAVAALDAIGASLQINGQYQIVSVSLLNGDAVTDDVLAHISRLKDLQSLVLAGPRITDEALQKFAGLKRLTTLLLRDTAATDEGIARLQAALPDCRIRRSTSRAGIRGAPNGFAAADAARVAADRQAALDAARERFGFGRGPAAADPFARAASFGSTSEPHGLIFQLLKTDVQIEIELTSQQWDQFQSIQAEKRAAALELMTQMKGAESDPEKYEQVRAEAERLTAAAQGGIKLLLSDEQYHRLQQLDWHARGPVILTDAEFRADLKLDDSQLARINLLLNRLNANREPRADGDDRRTTARERAALMKVSYDELLTVLSDEQRAAYEKKLGPPPEIDVERIGQHLFALLDTNGDEELGEEEWASPDTERLLSPARSRLRVTLPLDRVEFVRLFVSLREQPRGRTAVGF